MSVYKAFTHQHLDEIRMVIGQLQDHHIPDIRMLPFRGSFTRGILTALYMKTELTLEKTIELYRNYYYDHPFIRITNQNPNCFNWYLIVIQKRIIIIKPQKRK